MILRDGIFFPESDTHCSPSVMEPDHLLECFNYIEHFRTAVDGGAHVGVWSIIMALRFKEVFAYEPSEANFECLVENTKDVPNITTIQAALGSKSLRGSLHPPVNPGNSGASWIMVGDDFDIRTLDSEKLTDVDFIKLDVEGFEPFAIDGAMETIQRDHPVILVEQKPITARFGMDYREAGRILEEIGYQLKTTLNNDFIYAWK